MTDDLEELAGPYGVPDAPPAPVRRKVWFTDEEIARSRRRLRATILPLAHAARSRNARLERAALYAKFQRYGGDAEAVKRVAEELGVSPNNVRRRIRAYKIENDS